jgi:hypothetical protein
MLKLVLRLENLVCWKNVSASRQMRICLFACAFVSTKPHMLIFSRWSDVQSLLRGIGMAEYIARRHRHGRRYVLGSG